MTHAPLTAIIEHAMRRELRSLRLELEAYPEEALIWAIPEGLPNSAGTLALHLAGNLRHFIGARLGGSDYLRDRDREFAARGVPRGELLAELAAADEAIRATLPRLTEEQLAAPFPQGLGDRPIQTADALVHLSAHLAYHLGQISYHRRVVTGDHAGVGALPIGELFTARPRTS